jgi:hypothetical protein
MSATPSERRSKSRSSGLRRNRPAVSRRTLYRVAGESLLVETRDSWATAAVDTLFAGWYLMPDDAVDGITPAPGIVMSSEVRPAPIPKGLEEFEVAGGGTCYTDGRTSYLDIEGSVVAIGEPGAGTIEVRMDGPLPLESPALTRVVTYALSAALRQRDRFELHSAAVVDPESGKGVLIAGPSGSGKSTLSVHAASAGWPFLTDDVLLLSRESAEVRAWPLRRCFAVTSDTFAASRALQARTSLDEMERQPDEKRQFLPHEIFAAEFRDHCVPGTILFPTLSPGNHSEVSRLSPADTMSRLIRMNPWSCYDRSTAAPHLAVLSALAKQAVGYSVVARRDLLDPEMSVKLIAACARES